MSFGFFKKLGDVAKKIGGGIVSAAKKVWNVAKPVLNTVMPLAAASGHPAGQAASTIYQHAAPIADYLLGSR